MGSRPGVVIDPANKMNDCASDGAQSPHRCGRARCEVLDKWFGRGVPRRQAHRGLPITQLVVCFAVNGVADLGLFDPDMAKDRFGADVVAVRGVFDQLFLGQLEAFRDAAASLVDGSALLAMSIRR